MFSVRDVYSGRFNLGATNSGPACLAVTFRYTSQPRRRSQQSRKSIRRTGQTGRTRRRGRGGGVISIGMSFSRSAPCLLERGTLFSRYVTLAGSSCTQTPRKIRDPFSGKCNCIFLRSFAPFRPDLNSPGSPRRGLQSEDVSLLDFPSPWHYPPHDGRPLSTPFFQFVEELTSARRYTVTGR